MVHFNADRRYFLYSQPVHINRSFYRLAAIVKEQMLLEPMSADSFIFFNRACTQVKILCWEGDGFSLYHKRLEKGRFEVTVAPVSGTSIAIAWHQLLFILQGISLKQVQYKKRYQLKLPC